MQKYCSTLYFELVPLYTTIVIQGEQAMSVYQSIGPLKES